MENDVNTFKVVSKLVDLPDVPYDDASRSFAKVPPRFFFGSGQRPHLMAGLKKKTHQVISQESRATRNKRSHDSSFSMCLSVVANRVNTSA
jgi:hypothetical protein